MMSIRSKTTLLKALLAPIALMVVGWSPLASAEVAEVRIAKQYGLSYLPLVVIEEQKLIEKHARAAGLGDVKVSWLVLSGGSATNDALISGAADYATSGVTPMILLWAKSNGEFNGVAALSASPMFLNTTNPAVKSIKDFTEKDRIALPAIKVSIQAVVLQMAAAKAFGPAQFSKLDPLTVTMKHPDALAALLAPRSEITGHFATAPYMFRELNDKRVHTALNSYDVLGGPHTQILLSSSRTFARKNPRVFSAVLAALEEASAFITANKRAAAELYLRSTKSKEPLDEILAQLNDPNITFGTEPVGIAPFVEFLNQTGGIKRKPTSWKELFSAKTTR